MHPYHSGSVLTVTPFQCTARLLHIRGGWCVCMNLQGAPLAHRKPPIPVQTKGPMLQNLALMDN